MLSIVGNLIIFGSIFIGGYLFKDIKSGMIADGTAIGMGLATAVNRLKDSKAISRVIILLTDGVNNQGLVAPLTAAEIAEKFGIRVYTIGVGTEGYAPYPFRTPFGVQYQDIEVQIDEKTLQDIATITDGKYFRATNNKSLKEIYQDINKLEKSKIETTEYHKRKEEFLPYALLALLFLCLSFVLKTTFLKVSLSFFIAQKLIYPPKTSPIDPNNSSNKMRSSETSAKGIRNNTVNNPIICF